MSLTLTHTRFGRLLVYPKDAYVGRSLIELGEFMPGQVELFQLLLRPDMIVVDVGANIGAHTVLFAQLGQVVHAFEPQRQLFHVLCGNIALNGLLNVLCYNEACGEKVETLEIPVLDTSRINNLGAFCLDGQGDGLDCVDVRRLEIPCHFLKVDVEGWESQVLRGAADMIKDCQPTLYVENDKKDKTEELLDTIWSLGYKAYWHITPMFAKDNFRGSRVDPFPNVCSFDVLCLPAGVAFTGLPPVHKGNMVLEMAQPASVPLEAWAA